MSPTYAENITDSDKHSASYSPKACQVFIYSMLPLHDFNLNWNESTHFGNTTIRFYENLFGCFQELQVERQTS